MMQTPPPKFPDSEELNREGQRVQKNRRKFLNWPLRCLLLSVIVVAVCTCLVRYSQIKDLRAQQMALEEQVVSLENSISEMQDQLDNEMSREYIIRIAREKLHLYFPDDVIFYTNMNE